MSGKDLDFIAKKIGLPPGKAALDILKKERLSVVAVYFAISSNDVDYIMKNPLQVICADGIIGSHPHLRTMVPSHVY